jgi:large subunit ribosomal protein L10
MALTKTKKSEVVSELQELFTTSKLTVVAKYQGINVKSLQSLRKDAKANGTTVKVVKNRLVKKAIESTDALKAADTSALKDMLLYAFNGDDEVASAQVLNTFMKKEESLVFVGAITHDGKFMSAEEVKTLASLPGKHQLIAGVINVLQSPLRNVTGSLQGNLHGLLDAVGAKASN